MSGTFGQLIDETAAQLRSHTRDQELATWLTSSISSSAQEIFVNNPDVLSRGRIEIGSELIILEDVDTARKVGVIPPYGRGADGTTPASHAVQSKVTVAPLYPRKAIGDAINQIIVGLNGRMFGVETVELPAWATRVSYELPADTNNVLSISIPAGSVTQDRWYARDWTFDPQADCPSGKGVYIYDIVPADKVLLVTVATELKALDDEEDLFTESGMPDSARDVVMFGAASRLIATAGTYQLNSRAVGSQTTLGAQMDMPLSAMNVSKYFYSLHLERLEVETMKLLNKYVNRVHYSRGS